MRNAQRLFAAIMGSSLAAGAMTLATPARADGYDFGLHDPTYLMVGVGGWEVARDNLRKPELDLVLRPAHSWWVIKPQLTFIAAGDGDFLFFAGPMIDYYITPHVVGTISTSVGTWIGNGFDLGSRIEFHSGAEFAYRFADASRLGFGFFHTSNADITKRNPGSESMLLEYSIPIRIPHATIQ